MRPSISSWSQPYPGKRLELVRLSESQIAAIPITDQMETVKIHFCDEPEIGGGVHCNGPACVLCRAGRKVEERALLPVFLPSTQTVSALSISRSIRPGALLPQIKPALQALQANDRVVLLMHKPDKTTFRVACSKLPDDVDDGRQIIAEFVRQWEAREVELASVYQTVSNSVMASVPSIATMLRLKGIDPNGITD